MKECLCEYFLSLSIEHCKISTFFIVTQSLWVKDYSAWLFYCFEKVTWPLWILVSSSIKGTLLLLLSHFSRVRLCATPWTAAHQAPPSLGFSRQEHWSGLPFPSPMQESEKWKWNRSVMSDSATPWTAPHQAPLSLGFSRQEYWSGVPLPSPIKGICWT